MVLDRISAKQASEALVLRSRLLFGAVCSVFFMINPEKCMISEFNMVILIQYILPDSLCQSSKDIKKPTPRRPLQMLTFYEQMVYWKYPLHPGERMQDKLGKE